MGHDVTAEWASSHNKTVAKELREILRSKTGWSTNSKSAPPSHT
eukprot:CAMPEP_0119326744 /NCGR_PEP_ID=MMETSP1333-20130426/69163_1 /TAXON_ID=418940 /ORGANISM="Scyphosphaera apsteinii, Strain RCC1455" /LENGTH=43 /DNA_ID= /DNA_START= /DNA_END= /DNA_ORIENTATION=